MALSLSAPSKIVEVVRSDISSRACIEGPKFPAIVRNTLERAHWSGGARNFFLVLAGMGSTDREFVRVSCVGIAEATSVAINAAIMKGNLPGVRASRVAERVIDGYHHKSTGVAMRDGKDYVFDWWPTLNPKNPLISTEAQWRIGQGAIEYKRFRGFT